MYLDELASAILARIPEGRMPHEDTKELLKIYAVLARAKGTDVTCSDVHDAWSAWMSGRDPSHESLVPFEVLPDHVKAEDAIFADAIRAAALEAKNGLPSHLEFMEVLFPSGLPKTESQSKEVLDLYKIMVGSSESLVQRRQAVNTFFLTINGALLTAGGLIVQSAQSEQLGAWGVAVLAVAGLILCGAWRSLITSFGQLNKGKFKVINTMERHLKSAIYAAEWEALGRGEDPNVYRSFTSREIWVPTALLALHAITFLTCLLVAFGCISFRL
ncbi:RipA family octameric membrane protein [Stenotrophomonas sp. 3(2025)]|uniref:RipA family octameric membrane protein n=1 Tax=Stenotrophomonas sp. 3(2025) TaxID=3456023 RepID=UPI004044D489